MESTVLKIFCALTALAALALVALNPGVAGPMPQQYIDSGSYQALSPLKASTLTIADLGIDVITNDATRTSFDSIWDFLVRAWKLFWERLPLLRL